MSGRARALRLSRRLWLLLTGPVVLCLAIYGVLGARFHRRVLLTEAEHEVRETGTLLGTVMSSLPPDIESAELHLLAERFTRDSRVLGVGVYDPNGQWLGGSRVAFGVHEAMRAAVVAALRARRDHQETRAVGGHPCVARVEVIATPTASPAGAVLVLRDLGYIDRAVATWRAQLAVVALALAAAMALAAAAIARSLTEPVERFLQGVARVASGDLDAMVPADGHDELARLGRGFNDLTASLREARARLADEGAARSALEAELHRAQMLAVAGQVAATLGHEIGSPLNVILVQARMTGERDDLDEETRATLATIATQCERITRVMSQFLSLTRPAPASSEASTDAGQVAREVATFLGHECRRRKVKAEVEVPSSAVRVGSGHDRLFQMMFNLAMNALQAQEHGGKLLVRVSRVIDRREGFDAREMACVEFADAGPGVPDAIRGKVFDPFFSTKQPVGGTGLGLAVVAGIVRDLGGRITVDNGLGVSYPGAVFRVLLPLA